MIPAPTQVWLVVEAIDMRAGIDGLQASYRFRHRSATAKSRIKAREQSKRGKAGGKEEPF